MSKKPFEASTIYVIFGLLLIAIIGLRTISTPEIWTHLAQGQNNVPISFLESDNAVNTTHLYDKLAYTAWNIGGAPLLIILNIAGLLGSFLLLIQVSKKWGGGLSQGFALLISAHLIFQTLDVGPQVPMMLFIALFLYLVTTTKNPAILFGALIPLQIIWTNMHGSFLYGPIILALTAFQASQQNKGSSRKANYTITTGTYGILAAALLIATLINPYFLKLHVQVVANIQSPAPSYWSSLFIEYFQIPALKPLILFVMILGAAGLITLKKRLPTVLTTLAIFGAFLVWTSPQASLLFVVLAFPFMVLSLTSISEYINSSLSSILGKQAKLLAPATGVVFALLIILSLVPIVGNSTYVKTGSASNFGLGIQENLYPAGAEGILTHPDFPVKTINLAADGGYLAFKYGRKCFVDYRSGRYDKELLKSLNSMMLGNRKAYDELYEEFRPEAIIINTLAPSSAQGIVTLLSRKIWKLVYFDGTTAILMQNKEKFAAILNNTTAQQAGLAQLEKARADYATKSGSCRAGNPAELIGSGKIYLAFNRPAESKAIFSLLLQGNGRIPGAWIGLGNSQLLLNEFDAAVQSLVVATKQAPDNLMAWISYATACKYAGLTEERDRAIQKARALADRNKPEEAETPVVEEAKLKELSLEEIAIP